MELQPILTKISDIGLTDYELEYNIPIKKYSAIGESGKLTRVKLTGEITGTNGGKISV